MGKANIAKCVLFFLLCFTGTAISQTSITNGLVAYYPFNGNANDESGHDLNGTVSNAFLIPDRYGIPNSAYGFNGSNCAILFASAPLTNVDNWTVCAWMAPAALPQAGTALTVGVDNGGVGSCGYWLSIQDIGNGPGSGLIGGFPQVGPIDSGYVFPTPGRWYHAVMLRDSGTTKFYVNGIQTTGTDTRNPLPPTAFVIGSATGQRFFNGALDDIRIYNRALSSNEVQQLYQFESLTPCVRRAAAVAAVASGFVTAATVTDRGCGYSSAPLVLILGGGGTGATATATITNGYVANIAITYAGSGYTSAPTVYIYSPIGLEVGLEKSVRPMFSDLIPGTNYQLQGSIDLSTWINLGAPFPATNPVMTYPQYFQVDNWNQFFFRVQVVP